MLEPFSGLSHNPKASSADCAQADPQARANAIEAMIATGDSLCMGIISCVCPPAHEATKLRRLRGNGCMATPMRPQRHEPNHKQGEAVLEPPNGFARHDAGIASARTAPTAGRPPIAAPPSDGCSPAISAAFAVRKSDDRLP